MSEQPPPARTPAAGLRESPGHPPPGPLPATRWVRRTALRARRGAPPPGRLRDARPYQQPYARATHAGLAGATSNGLAVAALVVGIIGLLVCWVPYLGVPLPIIAFILGSSRWPRAKKITWPRHGDRRDRPRGSVSLLIAVVFTVWATIYLSQAQRLRLRRTPT